MRSLPEIGLMASVLVSSLTAVAQETVKPSLVLRNVIEGMPTAARQEVSVFTARFDPGQSTVFHTHRFPMNVAAGQSFVEPPNIRMTGYNRSATEPLRLVVFYVGDPGSPFLDLVAH